MPHKQHRTIEARTVLLGRRAAAYQLSDKPGFLYVLRDISVTQDLAKYAFTKGIPWKAHPPRQLTRISAICSRSSSISQRR
jgi:hypothetical protein